MNPTPTIRPARRGALRAVCMSVGATLMLVCCTAGGPGAAADQTPSTPQILAESVLSWQAAASESNPPPLVGASAVYDSDNQTVVMFGGRLGNGSLSRDTWVWNGTKWTDFRGSQIEAPPARQLAAMAFDPSLHQLIVFGGQGSDGQLLDDTWAWNGVSWYPVGPALTSVSPPPLAGASMAYDPDGDLVLFGGTMANPTPGPAPTTTTSAPTTSSTTSTTLSGGTGDSGTGNTAAGTSAAAAATPAASPATTAPARPPATTAPAKTPTTAKTATTAKSATGSVPTTDAAGPTVSSNQTWIWTTTGWSRSGGAAPPARSLAAMTYDSSRAQTVLFGGQPNPVGTGPAKLLADTWIWTGAAWTQAKPKTSPPARSGAVASDEPALAASLVYGGAGVKEDLTDIWLWSGSNWIAAKASETPAGRDSAVAVYDGATDALVMFGGSISGILSSSTDLLSATLATTVSSTSTGNTPPTSAPRTTTTRGGAPHPTTTTVAEGGGARVVIVSPFRAPLTANAHTLRPGGSVSLFGSGFVPGAEITITFHSTPERIGRARADANGQFSATVTVPDAAPAGPHHLEASGATQSGTQVLSAAVEVAGSPLTAATPRSETYALLAASLAIPAGAWLAMSGAGWLRRRSAAR